MLSAIAFRQVNLRLTQYSFVFLCGTLVVLMYNALLYYAAYPPDVPSDRTTEVARMFLGLNNTDDIVLSMIGTPVGPTTSGQESESP